MSDPIAYLDAEALRLRAERSELLLASWRRAARALGFTTVAVSVGIIVFAGLHDYRMQVAADQHQRDRATVRQLNQQLSAAHATIRALESGKDGALRAFQTCRSANGGLFEGIKEQQKLLREAVARAKRCSV